MELDIPKHRRVRIAMRLFITAHRKGKIDVTELAERFHL